MNKPKCEWGNVQSQHTKWGTRAETLCSELEVLKICSHDWNGSWVAFILLFLYSSWAHTRLYNTIHIQAAPYSTHWSAHIHTTANLESLMNLTCKSLDCGKKLERPEKTHACTGSSRKLHTERPQGGSNQESLWGESANYCTTVVLSHKRTASL